MIPRVICIGGSDCSGGAGIQADVKTVTLFGGYAATVVTAVTVQDSQAVSEVLELDPFLVERQLTCVLNDIGADAIKIGMLGSPATVELVARVCEQRARHIPIVLDPVIHASAGARLQTPAAVTAIRDRLLPRAALVTPNLPEASELSGTTVDSIARMQEAAERFLCFGASAVLIKGGHLDSELVQDLLRTADGLERWFETQRIPRRARGTGCTLASAIAVGLAEGMTLESAIERAERYVHEALAAPTELPSSRPPLFHGFALRPVRDSVEAAFPAGDSPDGPTERG